MRTVLPRVGRPATLDDLELTDVEAMRLLLRGDSVVDWHRLGFADHAEVDRFLRLNEFDPESDAEMDRLEDVRVDAVEYIGRVFQLSVPHEVAEDVAARDLLLMASRSGPLRQWACVVLKVMHIMHHIGGRNALLKVSVSDELIFRAIERKVMNVVEQLRAAGAPITELEWSRKPRDSQVTKLMAKRSTLAANIYDKLRFRLIVPTYQDLVPMLATLTRQLIPFNYLVPGETVNQLIDLEAAIEGHPRLAEVASRSIYQRLKTAGGPQNEFSGPEYRILNFIADLPLRLESIVPTADIPPDLSHVVFVLTEFQIADKATALRNESGHSSHEAYKARQHERVRQRLFRDEDEPLPPA